MNGACLFPSLVFRFVFCADSELKLAFKELMASGCSKYEQQLRNDILVISTLIAQHPGTPVVETGETKRMREVCAVILLMYARFVCDFDGCEVCLWFLVDARFVYNFWWMRGLFVIFDGCEICLWFLMNARFVCHFWWIRGLFVIFDGCEVCLRNYFLFEAVARFEQLLVIRTLIIVFGHLFSLLKKRTSVVQQQKNCKRAFLLGMTSLELDLFRSFARSPHA